MAEAARRGQGRVFGLLAQFPGPQELLRACRGVRDAGYGAWDAHAPFPVHGFEEAMALERSRVSLFVLVLGLSGAAAGMVLQWWVSSVGAPLVVSGKPFFSWPAFVPIMFECGVLGGALGALFAFLLLAGLPRHHHPLFKSERFQQATDDGFFISIEATDDRFHPRETRALLQSLGASHVELVAGAPVGGSTGRPEA
jgi:hypothetical protein